MCDYHSVNSSRRIDLDVKDNYERTALHWACADGHGDIVRLLVSNHALDSCIDTSGLTALHYCIESKSVSSVEHLVTVSEMTHLPNNDGKTPLMEAAAGGMSKIVVLLLRSRAVVRTIDHRDPQGMSSESDPHDLLTFTTSQRYSVLQ